MKTCKQLSQKYHKCYAFLTQALVSYTGHPLLIISSCTPYTKQVLKKEVVPLVVKISSGTPYTIQVPVRRMPRAYEESSVSETFG